MITFFQDEAGAKTVEDILFDSTNNCLIHVINLCEVYYDFYRNGGEDEAEKLNSRIK